MLVHLLAIIGCFGAGFLGGLFGVGGGILMVPLFYYGLKMNLNLAVGTSLAIIILIAISGTVKNIMAGNIHWHWVLIASVFVVIGSFLGASLSLKMDLNLLRKLFALMMTVIAIKMFIQ